MPSKKPDLAARAADVAARRTASSAAVTPTAPPVDVVRTKPVRLSTDLAPVSYRFLTGYASDVATHAGRARIAHSDIIRALITELEHDPQLRARITDTIANQLRD